LTVNDVANHSAYKHCYGTNGEKDDETPASKACRPQLWVINVIYTPEITENVINSTAQCTSTASAQLLVHTDIQFWFKRPSYLEYF